MTRPTPFFATRGDLLEVLEAVEQSRVVAYALSEMGDSPQIQTWNRARDIRDLGILSSGEQATSPRYLICDSVDGFRVREVPQRQGGVRFICDLRGNANAVGFCAGGLYDRDVLICGQLGAGTQSEKSRTLATDIKKQLEIRFTRIRSYWVGSSAADLLDSGIRLTANPKASVEYDLRR